MKKNGFSLTEILMLIFTIIVIAAALFPLKIIDLNQAERIAEWKTFYPELQYSFKLMQSSEKDFVKAYDENKNLNSDAFFCVFTSYLNIDKAKTEKTDFSKYRKSFMNGKIITKKSKYKADIHLYLQDGKLVSFVPLEREKASDPLGLIFIDINGRQTRNFVGRDVFPVLMFSNKIEPVGYNSTRQAMKENCSPVGSGMQCSAYYLVGGAF